MRRTLLTIWTPWGLLATWQTLDLLAWGRPTLALGIACCTTGTYLLTYLAP